MGYYYLFSIGSLGDDINDVVSIYDVKAYKTLKEVYEDIYSESEDFKDSGKGTIHNKRPLKRDIIKSVYLELWTNRKGESVYITFFPGNENVFFDTKPLPQTGKFHSGDAAVNIVISKIGLPHTVASYEFIGWSYAVEDESGNLWVGNSPNVGATYYKVNKS